MGRVLVLGRNGQLASELYFLRGSDPAFSFVGREAIEKPITALLEQVKPSVVVNCLAYTAVDNAELNHAECLKVNRDLPGELAQASLGMGFHLIHFSTDYVFNGSTDTPYLEADATSPVNFYGLSKVQGEEFIRYFSPSAYIVRTSWIYSQFGHNFLKTMLRLGRERECLRVVSDQIGCPTWARDLAAFTVEHLMERVEGVETLNYSGGGQTSWDAFARKIFELSGILCDVIPIPTTEYPTPARRPKYSVLSKAKVERKFGISVPVWDDSLKSCLEGWREA